MTILQEKKKQKWKGKDLQIDKGAPYGIQKAERLYSAVGSGLYEPDIKYLKLLDPPHQYISS